MVFPHLVENMQTAGRRSNNQPKSINIWPASSICTILVFALFRNWEKHGFNQYKIAQARARIITLVCHQERDRTHDAYRRGLPLLVRQPDTAFRLCGKKRGTYHRSRNTAATRTCRPRLHAAWEHILTETRNQLCFWQPGQHPQDEMLATPLKSRKDLHNFNLRWKSFCGHKTRRIAICCLSHYNDEIVPVSPVSARGCRFRSLSGAAFRNRTRACECQASRWR